MMLDQYTKSMRRRRRSEATIRTRLFYLKKFDAFLGPRELVQATTDDMYDYLDSNPKWSPATKQSIVSSIRVFYAWAFKRGYVQSDESEEFWAAKVHQGTQRMASEEAIRKALERSTDAEKAMILLGAECGLRVSEIASLHLSNRHEDFLTIVGKGNKQRTVHMSDELATVLTMIENTTMRFGNYFPGQSGKKPMHPTSIWRHITKVLESNPHSLRHRAGTIAYRKGGRDIRLAQTMLGHASPVTTAVYVHMEDDDLRRASTATRVAA